MNIEQRLNSKTVIDPITGCWLWQGSLAGSRYGKIKFKFRDELVHRVSAHLYLGYNLGDFMQQVNHKSICPNKNCWNPEHLYVGTQKENVRDSIVAGTYVNPMRDKGNK